MEERLRSDALGIPTALIVGNLDDLLTLVGIHRASGRRIVLTSGTFDLFHIGHAEFLRQARAKGHFLVVGVDSDEKVKKRKGPTRPQVPCTERMAIVAHSRYADAVIEKPDGAPKWELILRLRPDVLVVTEETYTGAQCDELRKHCGELIILPPQATTSTSARLRTLQLEFLTKLAGILPKILAEKMMVFLPEIMQEAFDQMVEGKRGGDDK